MGVRHCSRKISGYTVNPSQTLLHAYVSSCLRERAEDRPCSRVCSTGPGCSPSLEEYQCKLSMSTWHCGIRCKTYSSTINQTEPFGVGPTMELTRRNLPTTCCIQHPLRSWVTNSFGKPRLHCGSRSFFGWHSGDATGPETGELGTG